MNNRVYGRAIVLPLALTLLVAPGACRRAEQQATTTTPAPANTPAGTASGGPDGVVTAPPNVDTVIAFETAKVVTRTAIGSSVGSDGMVMTSKKEFKAGDPIRLSMWLKDSPASLQMRAAWYDDKEKLLHEEQKPMNGGTKITFDYKGKRLAPGKYEVVGYWGGNIVAEYEFTVVK
jgi:hypothetical protein